MPWLRQHDIVRSARSRGAALQCKACGRTFTDFTGTVLHVLRRLALWLDFCRCLVGTVREKPLLSLAYQRTLPSPGAPGDIRPRPRRFGSHVRGIVELGQLPMLTFVKDPNAGQAHM